MTLRHYILVFGTGTMIAFVAWALVVLNIDPISAGIPAVAMFYVTLFAGLVGLFTTGGTLMRAKRHPNRDLEDIVTTSLRHGFLFALLIETVLFLASQNWLSVPALLILIGVIGAGEFVILSKKHGKRKGFRH